MGILLGFAYQLKDGSIVIDRKDMPIGTFKKFHEALKRKKKNSVYRWRVYRKDFMSDAYYKVFFKRPLHEHSNNTFR